MTTIEITGDELVVHVQGWDQLWAFKSELRIPLQHVAGAQRSEGAAHAWPGLRVPGTSFPGFIAGTYYAGDGRAFWDVHTPGKAIEISLHDDHFAKLVIDVEDPAAAIAQITRAVAGSGASPTT